MALIASTFDAERTADFTRFQSQLYADDANWIAPLAADLQHRFGPDFGFHRRVGNQNRHFVAHVDGRTVGHALAMVNRDLKDRDGAPLGAIGHFECIEDYAVAADLLDAATGWLDREHGLRRIWGPIDFDIWHGYRFMTSGFDRPVFHGEPYNKPYYPEFFERFGFTVQQRWSSAVFTGRRAIKALIGRSERRYRQLTSAGCRFSEIDLGVPEHRRALHRALTGSFNAFPGFTPLPFGDFERQAEASQSLLDSRLMNLIYDEADALAGFAIAFPDYSAAVRALRGRPCLASKRRFMLSRARGTNRAVFHMMGLMPGERGRRRGLGPVGFHHTVQRILARGFEEMVVALMADDSPAKRYLGSHVAGPRNEYALYELSR